ncbi:MAG: polysaccharide deacetylase family protein [Candidatus Poribacteria bacterium]|nr:polysaccharide deacetylase family protein [Candidatus Poribacteria bacterium]MDE0503385.1 polysaccharide deacetylase family protein [Candidatus Poribacteria bacterium]
MSHLNRSCSSFEATSLALSVPVLAYHKIDGGFELGINSISPDAFDRQMRFLAENGYTAISVNRLIQAVDSLSRQKKNEDGHSLPSSQLPRSSTSRLKQEDIDRTPYLVSSGESNCGRRDGLNLPPKSIVITFDDGYEDFYTSANPILTNYGMTATVFVLAGYIGKSNTWDVRLRLRRSRHLTDRQIQTLFGKGIGIASHGMYHRFLTRCSNENRMIELWESKEILENLLHHPVYSFSYPYGCENAIVAEQAKSAGYRIAFGLNPNKSIAWESIYRYPRIAVYRCDTLSTFKAKLGLRGKHRFKLECLKNRVINRFAYLNRLRR